MTLEKPRDLFPAAIVSRKKGQRYEKFPVGDFDFLFEGDERIADLKVLGQFEGYDGWGGTCVYDALLVEIAGRVYPCYRKNEGDGRNFAICQFATFFSCLPSEIKG